jgi:hypothetical protein
LLASLAHFACSLRSWNDNFSFSGENEVNKKVKELDKKWIERYALYPNFLADDGHSGTDLMILKIFSPKNFAKIVIMTFVFEIVTSTPCSYLVMHTTDLAVIQSSFPSTTSGMSIFLACR